MVQLTFIGPTVGDANQAGMGPLVRGSAQADQPRIRAPCSSAANEEACIIGAAGRCCMNQTIESIQVRARPSCDWGKLGGALVAAAFAEAANPGGGDPA
jgi:hypothetical protein